MKTILINILMALKIVTLFGLLIIHLIFLYFKYLSILLDINIYILIFIVSFIFIFGLISIYLMVVWVLKMGSYIQYFLLIRPKWLLLFNPICFSMMLSVGLPLDIIYPEANTPLPEVLDQIHYYDTASSFEQGTGN
jgi:hypothetical protein